MTPGAMLVPEDHSRVPITIVERTDVLMRGAVNSNSGWRFEIITERAADGGPLPSAEQLQEILDAADP